MTIGIEHKLKGYLSRIEKIKVDGTREVISADIEVPNTIVNLGRRMVSGEWIHRDAGNDVSNNFRKNRITYYGNSTFVPDIAVACRLPNSINMSTATNKQYDNSTAAQNAILFTPGSIVCISTDGRDTSLEDRFTDYLNSIVKDANDDISDPYLLFYPASTNRDMENSTVKPYYYYGIDNSSETQVDIWRRKTMRSVAVAENSTIRSVLFCARKLNVAWTNTTYSHEDNSIQLFARIVLPEPITLEAGERLMVTYDFHIIVDKTEVISSMNGINYSVRPYIRCGSYSYGSERGIFSNYHPGLGSPSYAIRTDAWGDNFSNHGINLCTNYSFTKPPLFYVDDVASLLSNDSEYTANWSTNSTSYEPQDALYSAINYSKSGVITSSQHSSPSIVISNVSAINSVSNLINPQKPVSCYNGNIYSQNYPGCPKTMIRGLDWQLTVDGKATFESCYVIQPTAGAMNIYGLLAHGAIVCFGKYDENGTWVDEPIVKSATQKAMISLKTIWNFD